MTNEGEVYFGLYGEDFDPNEITTIIGIEPTSAQRKGNPIPKSTSWKLSVGKIESDLIDVYEMSSKLIEKLKPHKTKIISAISKHQLQAVLQVVLWVSSDDSVPTPAIGFEADSINFISSIGASIDIDTYRK